MRLSNFFWPLLSLGTFHNMLGTGGNAGGLLFNPGGGGNATRTPTSTTRNEETSTTSSTETQVEDIDETITTITDTMDANSRNAFNNLLATLEAGGTTQFQNRQAAADREADSLSNDASRLVANAEQNFTNADARADAQADITQLTETLLNEILPEITGAAEGAGASRNALAGLMSQEAAFDTAEAQASAISERQLAYGQLFNDAFGTAGELRTRAGDIYSREDELTRNILAAIEQGEGSYTNETVHRTGTNTTTSTIDSTTTTTGTSNVFDREVEDDISDSMSPAERAAYISSMINTPAAKAGAGGYRYGEGNDAFISRQQAWLERNL